MITQASLLLRPAYERAGEYRRPARRARPLSVAERQALRDAATVPPSRWAEVVLAQAVATTAAPPTVLTPVAAEDSPLPPVKRAAPAKTPKPLLGDLAAATLERYRKRYALDAT